MSHDPPGAQLSPRRAWLSAALFCAAMLILPGLTWLLAPRPGGFAPPPPVLPAQAAATVAPPPKAPDKPPPARPAAPKTEASMSDTPLVGVVLDPDGKPVEKAFVACDDRDQSLSTSTDAEGRFRLAAEAAGCLAVSHHPRFTPSERVRLVAGRDNVLRLNRGGAIAGEGVDELGRPVLSYLLAIESFFGTGESAEAPPPSGQARSIQDPNGAFLLPDLLPGRYVLTASADGRPPVKTSVINVEAGRTTHHVRIVLSRGATLSGRVVDAETRKPIVGAFVGLDALTSTNANKISPARTDDSGAYTLEGVPPGPFSIRVASDSYRTKIVPGITARTPTVTQNVELQPRGDGGAGDSELAGIGALLLPQPTGVMITMVLPGGPAEKVGLQTGDVIARIDGSDAQGLTMSDCVQRLRGPEGSRVSVSVRREQKLVDLTITRELVVRR